MANVYSPKDVDISFGGAINVDGWDTVTITRNTENTTVVPSADGRQGYTYSADRSGSFEIEVQQQNSAVNMYCAALQQAQDLQNLPLFFDITVSDKSGGVLCYLKACHLSSPADQNLAIEAGSRTWMFFVENVQFVPNAPGVEGQVSGVADAVAAVNTIMSNVYNS